MIPISLNLNNKNILIVGGGKVALRKTKLFLTENANITILSNEINEELQALDIKWIKDIYDEKYLNDYFIVYASTNNKAVNLQIIQDCNDRNILCGSATKDENVSFHSMAHQTTPIGTVALSTHQKMPYTKPLLKELTDTLLNHEHQLQQLSTIREYMVQTSQVNVDVLKQLYEVDQSVLDFIVEGVHCGKGYIFVYHHSDYPQHYDFDLKPSLVLSLKAFEALQSIFFKDLFEVIPLLLSDGYIYQKLCQMTQLYVHQPLITHQEDLVQLIQLLQVKDKINIWMLHPRSNEVLMQQIKSLVSENDIVQTFDDPLMIEKDQTYYMHVLLMTKGDHYHQLLKHIPSNVTVSKILPYINEVKSMIQYKK